MNALRATLEDYCLAHSDQEPLHLEEVNISTHRKTLKPRMLSGHFQGRILSLISTIFQPSSILEIGTFTGYSALCMAEGLQNRGEMHTIESNPELEGIILENFRKSVFGERIQLHIGKALEIIPGLKGPFDLVFIDADKENYLAYYEMILPKVKSGGLILVDNVLWDEKVLDPNKQDKKTLAIKKLNQHITEDLRVNKVLLPVRDGLYLIRKK